VHAAHPAFDVTPARYITAIITERGVAHSPFTESLKLLTATPPVQAIASS
jgi:methylthioribose-1-phosphate isomerase